MSKMDLLIARMEDPKFKAEAPLIRKLDPLDLSHHSKGGSNIGDGHDKWNFNGFNNKIVGEGLKKPSSDLDPVTELPSKDENIGNGIPSPLSDTDNSPSKWNDDFVKHKVDFKNFKIRYTSKDNNTNNSNNNGFMGSSQVKKRSSLSLSSSGVNDSKDSSRDPLYDSGFEGSRKHSLPADYTFSKNKGNSLKLETNMESPRNASSLDDANFTITRQFWENNPLPELDRPASPTLRERRMSGFPELDRASSPILRARRQSMWSGNLRNYSMGAPLDELNKEKRNSDPHHMNNNRRHPLNTLVEGGSMDPNQIKPENLRSKSPEAIRSASPTLRERRMSGFPELDKRRNSPPLLRGRRASMIPNKGNSGIKEEEIQWDRFPEDKRRTRSPSPSYPQRRRATMIPEIDRLFSPVQFRRRNSLGPEIKTINKNDALRTKNKLKTFDFKSFQFPLPSSGDISDEPKFDVTPGKGEVSKVVREEKVKRDNGKNKVRTIEDDNDYEDIVAFGHVKNIFTTLIQQEKETRKEREKHHHHVHRGVKDYTSANTGTFSDVMFPSNERNSNGQVQSHSNSDSCSSLCLVDDNPSINNTIPENYGSVTAEAGVATPTITTTADSLKQTPIIYPINLPDVNTKRIHRHHKSVDGNEPKVTTYGDDKKRLVYQFLQSMAPPSKNQLKKQGLLFTSESPLISSHSFSKGSGTISNGPILSSNKSLQSLLFHDLEHPENASNIGRESLYSKSSYSLSSYSSSSSSSSTSSSSSISDLSYSETFNSSSSKKEEEELEDLLDRYMSDYYQQHIALLLAKFDNIMKSHLKDSILKKETDFQKSLQTFDNLVMDLQNLKQETTDLKNLIKNKYMVQLEKDFTENDKNSFITSLENNVDTNIKQLESFESRMEVCQEKLNKQKDELKRMENLLRIEQGIIETKKSLGFYSKYRFVILDSFSLLILFFIVLVFVHPFNIGVEKGSKHI